MKIKKVEIQGFRAFSNAEDSTFDFMLNSDKVANLISIYAPNGFGKTSFYDAVEWGITNQISRFDRMSDFKRIKKDNKIGGKQDILKNVDSKTGAVKIDTTLKPFVRSINNKKEYNPAGVPDNKYFKEVVLSQDLIDTFIKEEKAEERYAKFVEQNPLISNYNARYKNLVKICDFNKQDIKDVDDEIKRLKDKQLSFDFEQENRKFEEINTSIELLKQHIVELELIDKDSFSQSKLEILTSIVKSRLISFVNSNDRIKKKIQDINDVLIATTPNSVAIYLENRQRLFQLNGEIQSLEKIVAAFRRQLDLTQSNTRTKLLMQTTIEEIEKLQKQKDNYKEYRSVADNNKHLTKQYNDSQTARERLDQEILKLTIELQNNDVQLQFLRKHIADNDAILKSIPTKADTLEKSKKEVLDAKNRGEGIAHKITSLSSELEESKRQLKLYEYYRSLIEKDIELLLDVQIFSEHYSTIKRCLKINLEIENTLFKIENLQEKISVQNKLNEDINNFLSQGLKLISESGDCKCPLCLSEFETQDSLLSRVSNNEVFGLVSKALLNEKVTLEGKLDLNKNDKSELLKRLYVLIDKIISEQKVTINKKDRDLKKQNIANTEFKDILLKLENNLTEINKFFGDLSTDDFRITTDKRNDDFKAELNDLSLLIESKKNTLDELKVKLGSHILERNTLQESLNKGNENEIYLEVMRFFKNELDVSSPDIKLLDDEISKKEKILADYKNSIELNISLEKDIDKVLSETQSSQEEVEINLKELRDKVMALGRSQFAFEQFLSSEFEVNVKDVNNEEVINLINTLKTGEIAKQKVIENAIENLNIVDSLKDDCLKITEFEMLSNEISELQKAVSISKKLHSKLEKEKNNLVNYLKETINGFFYKDLINALYRKIDPHPDYEEIEFECTFEDSKPRLQIYTVKYSNGKKERTVPALYFSTAQINILSLSIFLARALKAYNREDKAAVDCIFIDDPIQSMDSINILSFIDVFRGLIVNHNKQLIVSTHEENFHNLLQRKIPTNYFDSKYFEFETFGKLKRNYDSSDSLHNSLS